MGYEELIASLRKEGEERVRAIRNEAEAEAEKIRAETDKKIQRLREEFRKKEAELTKAQEADILSEAENKARIIRLSAEKSLSNRLFALTLSCLDELRNNRYGAVFSSLVKELPPASSSWSEVRVNSKDVNLAQSHFPESRIIPDNKISGGFEVSSENGRQRIINTFEKRLERAWDEILPLLVTDSYKAMKDEIPSGHKG